MSSVFGGSGGTPSEVVDTTQDVFINQGLPEAVMSALVGGSFGGGFPGSSRRAPGLAGGFTDFLTPTGQDASGGLPSFSNAFTPTSPSRTIVPEGQGLLSGGPSLGGFLSGTDTSQFAAPLGQGELDAITRSRGTFASNQAAIGGGLDFLGGIAGGNLFDENTSPNPFLTRTAAGAALAPGSSFLGANNVFLNEALQGDTRRAQLAGQFTGATGSSPLENARSSTFAKFAAEAQGSAADFTLGAQQIQAALTTDAANAIPGLTSSSISNMVQQLQVEALPRLVQDLGIERGIAAFNERIDTMLQSLAAAINAVTGNAVVLPGTAPGPSPISQLADLAGGIGEIIPG